VRIEKQRTAWDIDVRFVHFPLHPETPPEGLTLEQLFAGRGIDISAAQARMKALMDAEGLPYADRTMTYNSRLAQELAAYAVTQPGGQTIHDSLFRAYFVDGINIASIDSLMKIATSIGLQEAACRDVLASRRYRETVDVDWHHSRTRGITSVPTFVVAHNAVAGAQPCEVLQQLLEQSGARRKI
jgi:predicted DsbA family dithiol-disulfide isomerase